MKIIFHYDCGPWLAQRLKALINDGMDIAVCAENDQVHFAELLPSAEVLWHVLKPVTATHIETATNLRLIQKIGVGVNTIDLDAARKHGIAVCNMPGTNSRAVAEMTLGLMLAVLRKLTLFDNRLRAKGEWRWPTPWQDELGEINGRTIGFVGFGAIPRVLAPILEALGAKIVYTSRSPKDDAPFPNVSKQELLQTADIVSLHIPETPETRNWLNADAIKAMKPGAILINTARGSLVDEAALIAALKERRLAGAGLDVFVTEPVGVDNPLLALDNVIVVPHIAWLTRETLTRSIAAAAENVLRLKAGTPLENRVI